MTYRRRFIGCLVAGFLISGFRLGLPPAPAQAAAFTYAIDSARSHVFLLVWRKGLMSLLAHDHVMVASGISGWVVYDPTAPEKSTFSIQVPVDSIRVDPVAERKRFDLAGKLDDKDRAEIREIMLAPEMLNANRYPQVTVTLAGVKGTAKALKLTVKVRIRGKERVIPVTADVRMEGRTMRVTGEMEITQSQFGIEPYSTFLGAVAVEDTLSVRFELQATRSGG